MKKLTSERKLQIIEKTGMVLSIVCAFTGIGLLGYYCGAKYEEQLFCKGTERLWAYDPELKEHMLNSANSYLESTNKN